MTDTKKGTPVVGGFRRSIVNAGFRSTQTILLNILSLFSTAYIIRKLGPGAYGEWTTAATLVASFSVLTSLGLRGMFVRSVARDVRGASTAIAQQLGMRLALATLAAALVVGLAVILHYSATVLICVGLAALALWFNTAFTTISDLMEAFQRFHTVAVASLVGGLVLTGASVAAVGYGGGPVALAASYIAGPLVSGALLIGVLYREQFSFGITFSPSRVLWLLWDSRHFAVQQLLYTASASIALLMLPKKVGMAEFGIFTAGILLITRLAFLPDAIGTAFYPLISSLHARDRTAARRQALFGLLFSATLCVFIASTIVAAAPILAAILFPQAEATCREVIVITAWALPLLALESMMGYALNAVGREAAQARATFISASVMVALGAAVVVEWGFHGACWLMLLRPAVQIGCNSAQFYKAFCAPSEQSNAIVALTHNDLSCGSIATRSAY